MASIRETNWHTLIFHWQKLPQDIELILSFDGQFVWKRIQCQHSGIDGGDATVIVTDRLAIASTKTDGVNVETNLYHEIEYGQWMDLVKDGQSGDLLFSKPQDSEIGEEGVLTCNNRTGEPQWLTVGLLRELSTTMTYYEPANIVNIPSGHVLSGEIGALQVWANLGPATYGFAFQKTEKVVMTWGQNVWALPERETHLSVSIIDDKVIIERVGQ